MTGSTLEFDILVKSFFPIRAIRVKKDGKVVEEENFLGADKFEINYSNSIIMDNSTSLNIIIGDKAGRLEEYILSKNS